MYLGGFFIFKNGGLAWPFGPFSPTIARSFWRQLLQKLKSLHNYIIPFFTLLTAGSAFAAVGTGEWFWLGLPAAALLGWLAVVDFRKLFFLLFGCIPFSTEVELPGGFGTDLPTEPLILALLGIGFLSFLKNMRRLSGDFLRHPITIFLLAHLGWVLLTALVSEDTTVSMKWLAAKIWYIAVFYFLAGHFLNSEKDLRQIIWWMLPGLLLTITYCTVKHATLGFTFKEVNNAMMPFYRNKVMYSCLLAVVFPFLWMMRRGYPPGSRERRWLLLGIIFCLIGIGLSFTRAAYIVILASWFLWKILQFRQLKFALGTVAVGFLLLVGWYVPSNRYLELAPNYERTVTQQNFSNLLTATSKGEDVSTMERVNRWVAGFRMIRERPAMGWGPGTFTFFYEKFTVSSFKTWVSINKERSGIHCYFLMTAVEQGLPGFLIFTGFMAFVLLYGERIYHQTADLARRRMLLSAWLSFVIIGLLMLMNDLVETDKVGSFFFICCAIIVNADLANRAENR